MERRYQTAEHSIELGELHEFVRQHGETVCYDKGEQFECEGEPARWWAFVEKGYFKYIVRGIGDGREHIAWFSCENEFVGAYPVLLDGSKAPFTIEAMTPCRVKRISGDQLKQFFFQDFNMLQLGFAMTTHILKQFQHRSISFLNTTPIERYKQLLERCPGIVNDLSLQDIASFLNIAPQTLSQIRKNITFNIR